MSKEDTTLQEYSLSIVLTEVDCSSQETIRAPPGATIPLKFPSLEYDIASKRRSIASSAVIILLINGLIPAVLYYILQYGESRVELGFKETCVKEQIRDFFISIYGDYYRRDTNDVYGDTLAVPIMAFEETKWRKSSKESKLVYLGFVPMEFLQVFFGVDSVLIPDNILSLLSARDSSGFCLLHRSWDQGKHALVPVWVCYAHWCSCGVVYCLLDFSVQRGPDTFPALFS